MEAEMRLRHSYERIEARLSPQYRPELGHLVVPNGNSELPFHRWFHMKEAFSAQIVPTIISETNFSSMRSLRLLDPFAGGGTSLLSAMEWGRDHGVPVEVRGIELNPFLHLVASSRVRAATSRPSSLLRFAKEAAKTASRGAIAPSPTPHLSTFANTTYIPRKNLRKLLQLRAAIDRLPATAASRDLARVCLGAAIEPSTRLRRDGRALRFESAKDPQDPIESFVANAEKVAEDLRQPRIGGQGVVIRSDAREALTDLPQRGTYDLILFSPPYPNNIDYSEVYKLENWLLGLVRNSHEFRALRLQTLRSHPSVQFPDDYPLSSDGYHAQMAGLLAELLRSVPMDGTHHWRRRLILGYFEDMVLVLLRCLSRLRKHGRLVYVVGNSIHGSQSQSLPIAADLLIAQVAEFLGYEVDAFWVVRRPNRRGSDEYARESIIILKKGATG